jgi:valyl-tRNA synthetase
MSKSLGNVIDPQDVIDGIFIGDLHQKLLLGNLNPLEVERATKYQKSAFPDGIPQCGTDGLRFALVSYTTGGGDIKFDIKVIHGYRKFCNKIYQATKYMLSKLDADFVPQKTAALIGKESLAERWILHKMTTAAKEINLALADREFMKSTTIVYSYWYNSFVRCLFRELESNHPRWNRGRETICNRYPVHCSGKCIDDDPPLHAVPDGRAVAASPAPSR